MDFLTSTGIVQNGGSRSLDALVSRSGGDVPAIVSAEREGKPLDLSRGRHGQMTLRENSAPPATSANGAGKVRRD